jgi:hypothetical protein
MAIRLQRIFSTRDFCSGVSLANTVRCSTSVAQRGVVHLFDLRTEKAVRLAPGQPAADFAGDHRRYRRSAP